MIELNKNRQRRGSEAKYNSSIFQSGLDDVKYGMGGPPTDDQNPSLMIAENLFQQSNMPGNEPYLNGMMPAVPTA